MMEASSTTAIKPNGKSDRFRKQAERRVGKALELIRKIGQLSNKSLYEYNVHHVDQIFGTMRDELEVAEGRFARGDRTPPAFTLD